MLGFAGHTSLLWALRITILIMDIVIETVLGILGGSIAVAVAPWKLLPSRFASSDNPLMQQQIDSLRATSQRQAGRNAGTGHRAQKPGGQQQA